MFNYKEMYMQHQPRLSSLYLGMVTASLLLASSVSFATNYKGENYKGEAMPAPVVVPCDKGLRTGFYVGAQIGYDSYGSRATTAVAGGGASLAANPSLNPTGAVGGLFGGYGQYLTDLFYLGGEVFVNTSGASSSYNIATGGGSLGAGSYNAQASVGTSWGLAVLPGVKINNSTLGYLRLGYNSANLKGQESFTLGGVTTSASKSGWRGAFAYGLGMETAIVDNWSVRTEYTHASYNSFTNSNTGTKFSASDNQVMLGLSYHFA
jgi:outer membrane immunogenic protein